MTLETVSSSEFLNFIVYDTISATPYSSSHDSLQTTSLLLETTLKPQNHGTAMRSCSLMTRQRRLKEPEAAAEWRQNLAVQGRKKRRRKPRVCQNKEEAETQRMTHIAVERNRRKQMNEHLAVLRSLMPESYVQRGDQASIVGGAIEFVKELEHLLQSLEVQKMQLLHGQREPNEDTCTASKFLPPPFAQFFIYPQYTWSQMPNKYTSKTIAAIADIEVTLIETHANLRILSRRSPRKLPKVLMQLEEECQLTSADDIAGAVHHMLRIIEEEAALC
ncbi:DNA binding protein, putative [Ricinus communis]|uniref:DNA binding protein, putative n=1 Tax=Ricinus communis TaxID=3988 RepID=B9SNU7_RICCO|nr:DNA binding protein, putative [Ricinus communis]